MNMNEKLNTEAFQQVMYALTKNAANCGFIDFLESWGIDPKEYDKIREYLNETYGIETYV